MLRVGGRRARRAVGVAGVVRGERAGGVSDAGALSYFAAAFKGANDAMVILDDDRHYVDCNRAACVLLGVSRELLIGRRIDDCTPRELRGVLDERWSAFLADGEAKGETELLRGDGSRMTVEFTSTARVAAGLHLSVQRDVTEQRAAGALLERQRRQLTDAQLVGGFGSWECDLVAGTIEWSDQLHRICGVEPGTVSTFAQIDGLLHADDRGQTAAVTALARAGGEPFSHEFRIVRPDGTVRVLESRGEVIVDDGVAVRMFGTAQDITDRKQADAERQNVFTVLDASDDAITGVSRSGVLVAWNRGAEKLYGYTAREAIGQPLDLIVPPEWRQSARENLELIVGGGRVEALEAVRVTKDGRRLVVAMTLSPIIDATKEIIGVAAVGRDMTESKRAHEALAAAHAKAVEASSMQSQFMANMNHELRTPLNGVIGISRLLWDTDLDASQREYVEALRISGQALMSVIDDILDFSKLEAERLALEEQPFELRAAVEDVCEIVALGVRESAVELLSSFAPDLPALVWADEKRFRQVLTNLTGNAVKFTPAGEVAVHVARAQRESGGDLLRVEVHDTGIGIDAAAQESIFDSFAQADGSTTRRYGGTGLGLTIAKQLVELMGGEIGVRSDPGQGSTFWFALPLRPAQASSRAAPHASLAGTRILVADASATSCNILKGLIERWDAAVATVRDGEQALAALRAAALTANPYNLVLLDCATAGIAGRDLLRAIRTDASLTDVRLVTMSAPNQGPLPASRANVDGFVTKPIRQTRLHSELSRVLGTDHEAPTAATVADRAPTAPPGAATRRALVAEDNAVNQLVAVRLLERRGFAVDIANNGREAVEMHTRQPYDVIFMDCQMPELDGYELRRNPRNPTPRTPDPPHADRRNDRQHPAWRHRTLPRRRNGLLQRQTNRVRVSERD